MAQPRNEPPNLETRLLVWVEILESVVAEAKRTVAEIRTGGGSGLPPESHPTGSGSGLPPVPHPHQEPQNDREQP